MWLYKIYDYFKDRLRSKKTLTELMIVVDNAETLDEIKIVLDYMEEFRRDYRQIDLTFAKEHIIEKLGILRAEREARLEEMKI